MAFYIYIHNLLMAGGGWTASCGQKQIKKEIPYLRVYEKKKNHFVFYM